MAAAEHPDGVIATGALWDGRTRCRLCASDHGADHDWCRVAGALVCDECCEEVLGGEPGKLKAAAAAAARPMAPLEILASCASCPRLGRMLVDEEDAEGLGDTTRLH